MRLEDVMMGFAKKPQNRRVGSRNDRNYDVRISLRKTGKDDNKYRVSIGFLNKAFEVFSGKNYMTVTNLEMKKDNFIYFMTFDEKSETDCHVCKITNKGKGNCEIVFTPTDSLEKTYRSKWIGNYKVQYDEECGLYFIDRQKKLGGDSE